MHTNFLFTLLGCLLSRQGAHLLELGSRYFVIEEAKVGDDTWHGVFAEVSTLHYGKGQGTLPRYFPHEVSA